MSNEIYESMIHPRGAAYRDSQIKSYSHYRAPIDHGNGRLAGNSRVWGDASPEVQSRVIDELIRSSKEAGLTQRQTAQVLAIARVESGFNPDAAAGTTSASGLGQFIDKTGNHYGLNGSNRFDVGKQADALVAHYIDNMKLAKSRGQGEEYIYKYHHDGPTSDYGGLGLSRSKVMPYVDQYEKFVKQHWDQQVGQRQSPNAAAPDSRPDAHPPAQNANAAHWPAPGNTRINVADKPGEGRGEFGTPRQGHTHGGIDIQGKEGDRIEPFRPGKVVAVHHWNGSSKDSGGNYVVVDHGGGVQSVYMHLKTIDVKPGQDVGVDTQLGTMGRTGNTPRQGDTHLHFEIRDQKAVTAENPKGRVDPLPILNGAQQLDGPGAKVEARSELKLHDKGADVEHLQKRLNDLGYTDAAGKKLATDRDFGNHTREAVEQFQRENGLKATGVADKETLRLVEKGMTRHAAADGQLQPGEKGPDVRGLQENLNQLGLTGTNGKPLKVDGDYGDSTREAVRKFQEAHGLPQSGTADRATLEKLGEQVKFEPKITADGRVTGPITEGGSRTPPADTPQAPPTDRTPPQPPAQADKPSMADPKHPDNAMYKQALTNLEQLGPNAFKSREELERAAAAVTSDARASGLTSIDHVAKTNAASGNQTLLVAVQGDPTSPASKNSYIDYSQAVTQTVDQSSRMAEAAGARQAQQADAPQPEARVAVGAR